MYQGGQNPGYAYVQSTGQVQQVQVQPQMYGYAQDPQVTKTQPVMQQPTAQATTQQQAQVMVASGNTQMQSGKRVWNNGICGCFKSCHVCLCSFCLPCYVVGQNADSMGDDRMIYSVASYCLPSFVQFFSRVKIRKRLNIEGNELMDCCCVFCCQPCALAQERNEVLDAVAAGQLAP